MPARGSRRHTETRLVLAVAVRTSVCFRAVRAVTRGGAHDGTVKERLESGTSWTTLAS